MKEFLGLTRGDAVKMVNRLIVGYTDDRSKSGYPAAVRDSVRGCLVGQKAPNRAQNGYIQLTPISEGTRGLGGSKKVKAKPQSAARVVVLAFKSDADAALIKLPGYEASHLCHNPLCIEHLSLIHI